MAESLRLHLETSALRKVKAGLSLEADPWGTVKNVIHFILASLNPQEINMGNIARG